ncbi:MAG: LPS-assembly protein LptD, partial [Planktomarina sp.]
NAIFTYLEADPAEDRLNSVTELALNARYTFQQDWTVSTKLRYDFEVDETSAAQMGLQFRNECIDVNFTATRNFSSDSNDYGLTVGLLGFGAGDTPAAGRKTCRGRHE